MSNTNSVWKKKYEAAQKSLSKMRKRTLGGTKALGLGAGVGGAAKFAVDFAAEKVDFIRDNWWGEGAAIGATALLVRKKSRDAAIALAGAAGYALAQAYKRNEGGDTSAYNYAFRG